MTATAQTGIRVQDGGVSILSIGRTFGARRLKALLLLTQHPELDDPDWSGRVVLDFGGKSVKASVQPASREIVDIEAA